MNNELTTTNGQLPSLIEIRMDDRRFPRFKSYTIEQATAEMVKIVTLAFVYRGQAADPQNVSFIASALVEELKADLDKIGIENVTFAEMQRTVKKAVLNDDMFGVSVASLYKVISEYIKGEGHIVHRKEGELRRKAEDKAMRESAIQPMLDAYAGEFIRNNKI